MSRVRLSELIAPVSGRAGTAALPVYAVTKHRGFVLSSDYFKKQVFSNDLTTYKVVDRGQFAYATIHLDEGSIGVAPEPCLISPMYTVFSIDESKADTDYVIRYLKSPAALSQYPWLGRGTAERRKSISLDALGRLEIPLPPLPEQRRIAAILDEADALRAAARRASALQSELLTAHFEALFPLGVGDQTTIGDLVVSTQYGTSEKASETGTFPVLRMGNLTVDGRIDLTNMKYMEVPERDRAKYLVRAGDVLFNRTNSADLVGKTAVYREPEPRAYAGYLVRLRPKSFPHGEYIAGYLNSRHGKRTLRRMAKSIVGMANINAKEVQTIRLPQPGESSLNSYAQAVAAAQQFSSATERRAQELDSLFASLQHRAFRGEL